jgi:FAD-dependent urate hydroxylase
MAALLDAVIIGAGPYGLSCAAHLRWCELAVFGETMSFWRDHMPDGMYLRSPAGASSLAAPRPGLRLEDFERERDLGPERPVPLDTFIEYGRWFEQRAAPEPDPRSVLEVARDGEGLRVSLEDGDEFRARNVIVAAGIEAFARRPAEFDRLPDELVSHSVDHARLQGFRGHRVVVVGAGQSSLESAALLHEAGAEVVVLARCHRINWLVRSGRLHRVKRLERLLYGPSDVGPAGLSLLVDLPDVFRRFPHRVQDPLAARAIRPAASEWLVPRTRAVAIRLGRFVVAAKESEGRARLALDDGSELDADHVLLATGYRIDISHYPFLPPRLVEQIACAHGYPRLGLGFESSIPGLHFVGAPAGWSFGPLFRFVAGAAWAAPRVAEAVEAGRTRVARPRAIAGERSTT